MMPLVIEVKSSIGPIGSTVMIKKDDILWGAIWRNYHCLVMTHTAINLQVLLS